MLKEGWEHVKGSQKPAWSDFHWQNIGWFLVSKYVTIATHYLPLGNKGIDESLLICRIIIYRINEYINGLTNTWSQSMCWLQMKEGWLYCHGEVLQTPT